MSSKAILIEGSISKTILKLTFQMLFGIASMVALNLIDTFFISRLGLNALAAITFTFPIVFVINGFSIGLGMGAASVISKAFGKDDHSLVQRLTTDSLLIGLIFASIFILSGFAFMDSIFAKMGASQEMIPLIKEYMNVWLLGMFFVVIPMVGNSAIRASGNMKIPSIIMLVAVVVNLIMDPLLIFGYGPFPELGLKGAAIATVVARACTMVASLWVLHFTTNMLTFKLPSLKAFVSSAKSILFVGLPFGLSQVVMPIGMGFITGIVARYGDSAVAAFGVASRIEFFALALLMAMSSVLGPFIGQNFGAGKTDRIKGGIYFSYKFSLIYGLFAAFILAIFGDSFASLFTKEPEVISIIQQYLYIIPIAYGVNGIVMLSNSSLNVLNKPIHATVLTAIFMFLLTIPLAFFGANLMDLKGLFIGGLVSRVLSAIIAFFFLRSVLRKI